MKSTIATVTLGLLFAGSIEALPTTFSPSNLAQHIFGGSSDRDAQRPIEKVDGARQRCEDAPGIGFEFAATYATASIKYLNGTTIDVGKIDGDFKYKNTMLGLLENTPPLEPPFVNPLDSIKWEYQQALRTFRKLRGLPATEDIGILSSMLYELKLATESKTGLPVTRAVIGIPTLPHLLKGDIEEAFDDAGITKLESGEYDTSGLTSVNTAYAGMGYGLCSDWRDKTKCGQEEMDMGQKDILVVSLNEDSLTVAGVVMHSYISILNRAWTFDGLGYQNHAETDYWKNVAEKIFQVGRIKTHVKAGKIQQVIVMGERGEEKQFLDSLWFALNRLADELDKLDGRAADIYAGLQVSRFNSLYLGARGAAELAMRWQGDVQDCVEDLPEPEKVEVKEEESPVTIILTVAVGKSKADGGAVDVMRDEELKGWGVDTELMGHAVKQMQNDEKGRAWRIDAKYTNKGVELSGTVYEVVPEKRDEPKLGRRETLG